MYDPKDYEFSWGECHSIISTESWLTSYLKNRQTIANNNKRILMIVKDRHVHDYNLKTDVKDAFEIGRQVVEKSFLKRFLRETQLAREEFETFYKEFSSIKLNKCTDKNLINLFDRYIQLAEKTYAYYKLTQPEYLDFAANELKSILKKQKKYSEKDFNIITTPTEMEIIKEEEIATINLSLADGKVNEKKIIEHSIKFPWLFLNTFTKKPANDFVRKRIEVFKSDSKKDRISKILDISKSLHDHNVARDKILDKYSNATITYLADVFAQLSVDRLKLKGWWGGCEYLFLDLFCEIARRAKISADDLMYGYTIDDFHAFLDKGRKVSKKTITERRKIYVLSMEDDDIILYENKKALDIAKKFELDHTAKKVSEFNGMAVSSGIARGKVRIIRVDSAKQVLFDMTKFSKGDILVTTMTHPIMVTIAKRAAAIVTNEGGITSHASVVAREFKIPCIVGTHIATEVLKNGDLIEVDANKGIVRILKL